MIKTSAQLKQEAREQLTGRWSEIITASVIFIIISVVFASFLFKFEPDKNSWSILLKTIFLSPLQFGLTTYCVKFATYKEQKTTDIFKGYNRWLDAVLLDFIINLFTSLWAILFIIPGIIKGYSYSMSFYILADNPNMRIMEAFNWSKKITQGHKMRMFYLGLSFIGWYFLEIITCGIACIWVMPYINVTMANLYMDIKNSNDEYAAICENEASSIGYEDMRN